MNRTLNIRIVELLTDEKRSSIKYLYFLTHTTENVHKVTKLKITTNKTGNLLICEKFISFNLDSQLNSSIHMEFKRHRFLISDDFIGHIDLPLNWFPSNHIVREWFPIKKNRGGKNGGMLLLDVHVDCRGADPFMAPFAPLKVQPTWKRPMLSENAEILIDQPDDNRNQNQSNNIPNAIQYQSYPAPCFYPVCQLPPSWQFVPYYQEVAQPIPQQNVNGFHAGAITNEHHMMIQQALNQTQPQNTGNNHCQEPQQSEKLDDDFQPQVYYPQIPNYQNPYGNNSAHSFHPYQEEELKDDTN